MKHIYLICIILASCIIAGCSFTGNAVKESPTQEQQPRVMTCDQLKPMYIKDIADGLGVDADLMLKELVQRFDLKKDYTTDQTLAVLLREKHFMCTVLTDIAQDLRNNQTCLAK